MAMPALSDVTTIEQLRALPDDGSRHELLDGVHVVTPSPALPHQAVLRELMRHLLHAVGDHRQLEIFSSPADVVLGSRTLVQPDLFLVRVDPTRPPATWTEVGVPVLARDPVPRHRRSGPECETSSLPGRRGR